MKKTLVVVFAACALIIGSAGLAWACVVTGTTTSLRWSATSARPGELVSVHGEQWRTGVGQVVISLAGSVQQSAGVSSDGSFNASFRVPASLVPGDYRLSGSQAGTGEAGENFRVLNPDGSSPGPIVIPPQVGGTNPSSPGRPSTVVIPGAPVAAPAATPAVRPSVSAPTAGVVSVVPAPVATEGPGTASRPASVGLATSPATTGSAVQPGAPAARSAIGDLWSGFGSGSTQQVPGLVNLPSRSGPSPVALGIGFLTLGMAALFGGFGVAELRRRRATVPTGR